jgi:hypothetical protein
VADHVEPVVPERGHQRDQIGGRHAGVVTVAGLVGEPGPARVDGDVAASLGNEWVSTWLTGSQEIDELALSSEVQGHGIGPGFWTC